MNFHARPWWPPLCTAALCAAALVAPAAAHASPSIAAAAVPPPAVDALPGGSLQKRTRGALERAWSRFHAAERYSPSASKLEVYREVEELVDPLARAGSTDPDVYFLRFAARGRRLQGGNPLVNLTKLSSLERDLDRALELDPQHFRALAAKGGILLGLPRLLGGDAEKAASFLEQAIRLNPRGPGTRLEYARALLRLDREPEAVEQLRLAGHYACVLRRPRQLERISEILDGLQPAAVSVGSQAP